MNISIGSSDAVGDDFIQRRPRQRCLCVSRDDGGEEVDEDDDDDDYIESSTASVGDPMLRCSVCVQRILKPYLDRHQQAVRDHQIVKEDCAQKLNQADPSQRLAELQAESQRLREKLTTLRKECGDMAVRCMAVRVENDSHREAMGGGFNDIHNISTEQQQMMDLQRLENGLLEGSMMNAIQSGTDQVRVLRFQWARKVISMHRLDIDPDDIKLTPIQKRRQQSQPAQQLQRRARGIAKIGGLPLPNAGSELFSVLPPKELQSALRLVAMITSTVARCLCIVLPHPIILTLSNGSSSDIIDTVSDEEIQQRRRLAGESIGSSTGGFTRTQQYHTSDQNHYHVTSAGSAGGMPNNSNVPVGSSSTASLLSLMDGSYWTTKAKKALAKATGQQTVVEKPTPEIFVSTDATIVAQRLHHATAAILSDTPNSNSSKFTLSTDVMHQEEFAIALQLLQNDVIVLCIRAGVPVSKLWPAEAMLLNLHELDEYCQQQTAVWY